MGPRGSAVIEEAGASPVTLSASAAKHAAIAQAALRLFVSDGYARTSVDAIAAAAGVSKRTVYNHFGDKEQLFLSVIAETFAALRTRTITIRSRTVDVDPDYEHGLLAYARETSAVMARSHDRAALLRLVMTEVSHFPGLLESWRGAEPLTLGLTDTFARMSAEGKLAIEDPAEAAAHFFMLTIGQVNLTSLLWAVPLPDAEIDRLVSGGVRAFLRAYRPRTESDRDPGRRAGPTSSPRSASGTPQ